jgi:hypothetical protein
VNEKAAELDYEEIVPSSQIGIVQLQELLPQVGAQLLKTLARSTSALEWGDRSRDVVPSNGSVFFVDTGKALIAITARHVYEAYCQCAEQNSRVTCQIDSMRFNPRERLISLGSGCDLATFDLKAAELTKLGKTTVPWPPVIPDRERIVLFAGVPGATKKSPAPGYVDLGFYTAFAKVDSVNDRDISSVIPSNEMLVDVLGKGLPPPGYDLGGLSGGPVAVLLESVGILHWALSGVIYECGSSFQILKAARADSISADGAIA